ILKMNTYKNQLWPELIFEDQKDTLATVHLWTQIVGKIRLKKTPWTNHSWHVTLDVSPLGLTTGSIPYEDGIFNIDFDFVNDLLIITTSSGNVEKMKLYARSVASFYKELFEKLKALGVDIFIYATPNEIEPAIPFEKDETHQSYDHDQIKLFWEALITVNNIFTKFRAKFVGKCSPVHLFWGAFDLAVTRFSGRKAPKHPGGSPNMPLEVMQESYSHEVSSCGFWPGNEQFPHAIFYSYCYPSPEEFGKQTVQPKEAFYSKEMGEFILVYDVMRQSSDPENTLIQFLQSTYEAAAKVGNWNRESLEFDFSSFKK
ncbi:MAG: DUF5996 family protein, partial [Ginsengibacter sp.]